MHERESLKHERRSPTSAAAQAKREVENELASLKDEYEHLLREVENATREVKNAPPAAAAAAINPLDAILKTVAGMVPIVGPLLAAL